MRWNRFFDDLEDQLASEWEAERAVLDAEAERLRVSRLTLRERLSALARDGAVVACDVVDGSVVRGAITGVGADWMALHDTDSRRDLLVPLSSIVAVGGGIDEFARSAAASTHREGLTGRITFGFALRDLARHRVGVAIATTTGRVLTGTIDRVGADHLELALHDPGASRRGDAVTGHRLIPLAIVAWVRPERGRSRA